MDAYEFCSKSNENVTSFSTYSLKYEFFCYHGPCSCLGDFGGCGRARPLAWFHFSF